MQEQKFTKLLAVAEEIDDTLRIGKSCYNPGIDT
jgi:hypothetical protein